MNMKELSRNLNITVLFAAIITATYIYTGLHTHRWLSFSPLSLIALGANVSPLTASKESWRLIISLFIHGGLVHWLLNTYVLLIIGFAAEHTLGKVRWIALFLVSGIFGGLFSVWWHNHHYVTGLSPFGFVENLQIVAVVGASGAILGLASGLFVWLVYANSYLYKTRPEKPPTSALAQVVVINVVAGFFLPGVDNASHIGGVAGGLFAGIVLSHPFVENTLTRRVIGATLITALALGVATWACSRPLNKDVRALKVEINHDLTQVAAERRKARLEAKNALIRHAEAAKDARLIGPPVPPDIAKGQVLALGLTDGGATAMGPKGQTLLVGGSDTGPIQLIDLRSMTHVTDIAPGLSGKNGEYCAAPCQSGIATQGIAFSPDGRYAFVSDSDNRKVLVVDMSTRRLVASFSAGKRPGPIAIDKSTKYGYVLNIMDNTVTVFNPRTFNVIKQGQAIGAPPTSQDRYDLSMPFRPVFLRLVDKSVVTFDTLDGRFHAVGDRYNSGRKGSMNQLTRSQEKLRMTAAAADKNGSIWLVNDDSLIQFDSTTLRRKSSIPRCFHEHVFELAATADGRWLAVGLRAVHAVLLVDPITGMTIGQYPLPGSSSSIFFSADDKYIYATSSNIDWSKNVSYGYFSRISIRHSERGEKIKFLCRKAG
ncbi:MAG: rhomboid family intramembrane serine protease [Acidihalobacter sp.]